MGCDLRNRSCTSLEIQAQEHMDCESLATQVFLGNTILQRLVKMEKKQSKQYEQHLI